MSKRPNRFFSFSVAALASAVALASFMAGCSDTSSAGSDGCYDYSSFNSTSKTVKFQTDVLPIFRQSCGLSSACHGAEAGPAGQPYLGSPTADGALTTAQLSAIIAQNVGVASMKAATMKIVDASSPQTSFLMHKMDNTLKCADVKCETTCGSSMPLANASLSEADRDRKSVV